MNNMELLYTNNSGRKSFQWQLWPYCNNHCNFCFLGKTNSEYIKSRQLKSLQDLSEAIDKLDYNKYNNISLIGGEFFQGQLNDSEIYNSFFNVIKKIFTKYQNKLIGSMWFACTLTSQNQKHLYELLDLAQNMGIMPEPNYGASGLWLCTSWDAAGRFHTIDLENNWKYNIKTIKQKYPWIKFNTTIILQEAFLNKYINNEFSPKKFMEEFNTNIFYMQPCLPSLTEDMFKDENGNLLQDKQFENRWQLLKENFNKDFEFFPKRNTFIKFLMKYYTYDNDTFDKLFNIKYRSDELHLNLNFEDHDRTVSRNKDASGPEEDFPPTKICQHTYNYSPYVDSTKCCICDKNIITR